MKTFRQNMRLIRKNLISFLGFELSFRVILLAIFLPAAALLFQLSLDIAGFKYLSKDRLLSYLSKPTTIILLIFIIFSASLITLFEIFCLIQIFHASIHNQKISITDTYRSGLYMMKKCIKRENHLILLFALSFIPINGITILSGSFSNDLIPDFVSYTIQTNKISSSIAFFAMAVLFVVFIWYCVFLQCFSLENLSFKKAISRSSEILHKNRFFAFFTLLFWNIMIILILSILALSLFLLFAFFIFIFKHGSYDTSALLYFLNIFITVALEFYSAFSTALTVCCLSSEYYTYLLFQGEKFPPYYLRKTTAPGRLIRRVLLISLILGAFIHWYNYSLLGKNTFFWNQNIIRPVSITAHRGDSYHAPENSLTAFTLACDNHADVIELDVRKTKDGIPVVVHDSSLKRLTGSRKKVEDMTYSELSSMRLKSKTAYQGEAIPTLEETLSMLSGQIDLNIELKISSKDTACLLDIANLIQKYNFDTHCVISSQSQEILRQMRVLNSDIPTILILPVAYGDFSEFDEIDGFSIRSSYITQRLVNNIHDQGRIIYAWTANNADEISRMLDLGVDSVITDNPALANEVVYEEKLNPALTTWVRQLYRKFKKYKRTLVRIFR